MKFSLQSLLIIVAVFAIVLGWGLDHLRLRKAIDRLNAENTELIGRIMPSSGFAIPQDFGTSTVLLNSRPEDRKEMLRFLDRSITHGKSFIKPPAIHENLNE